MPLELKEFADLIDSEGGDDKIQEAIETAIQALLFHQVIYDDTKLLPRESMRLLREHRNFFEKYFGAAGYQLVMDNQVQMVAIQRRPGAGAPYGWQLMRLKKDETLVRLALRMILDDGWRNGSLDEAGRVGTDTDELVDMLRILSGTDPVQESAPGGPSPVEACPAESILAEARLAEILKDLSRYGAVRLGDRDKAERVTNLTILPGIRIHVPDSFAQRVIDWVEADMPGDLFEHIAEKKHEPSASSGDEAGESSKPSETSPPDLDADLPDLYLDPTPAA